MKRHLLFAMLCIVGALNVSAQQDVTATYLKNADFSSGTPIDNNVCTYGNDMAGNGTTYYGAQAIDGWTNASIGADADGYSGCGLAGAVFAYGGTPWLGGTDYTLNGPSGSGNAAGLLSVWGNKVQYTQDVTLPAGSYTVRFMVFNATNGSGSSAQTITSNLFGFADNNGTTYYAPNNTFTIGRWSTVAVTFTLSAETSGFISMGYVGPDGSSDMPHLFVDNVKILKNEVFEDCTSKVNKEGWTGASDGYQGGDINCARYYGYNKSGQIIYQTISGLEKGTYEVAVYANSQQEWEGTITQPQSDISYIGTPGTIYWINSYVRKAYPGDAKIGIYTLSDVMVNDGTLTLSYNIDQEGKCGWHHFQIKSLIRTNGLSLADYQATVLELKAKIAAIKELPPKMLQNNNAILAAISDVQLSVEDYENAINTLNALYDETTTSAEYYAEYTNLHNYVTALLAVPYVEKEDGAHADLEAANVEPVMQYYTDILNAIYNLNHAAWKYATDADPAANKQFDLTFFLVNPDVTKYWDGTWGIRPEGWFTDQTTNGQNFQVMQNDRLGPGGEVFMEYWSGSPAQDGFVLYQQVNLPSGTYKMTGRVAANFDNQGGTVQNVFFAANDVVGTPINSETLMDAEVEFTQDIEDIVKIGMIATEGNQARWMGINGIHLYKMGEKEPYRIEEWTDYDYTQSGTGDVYLLRDIKSNTYNTMVLPFNMNKDEIEQVFGIGTHVYLAERFTNNNISLRTPGFGDNSINEGQGEEKITANVPFVILPTLVDSEWSPNGVTIPGRTLVPSETVNPSYIGDKVTMLGNYASSYQVPQVGMVNWVIGYKTNADAAGTANFSEAKLYYVNSEVTLATTYCHFALEGATEAKAIGFDVEGDATGIAVVENGDVKFYSGKAYDLSGREVKNPGKGLYIIGGKKVLIK